MGWRGGRGGAAADRAGQEAPSPQNEAWVKKGKKSAAGENSKKKNGGQRKTKSKNRGKEGKAEAVQFKKQQRGEEGEAEGLQLKKTRIRKVKSKEIGEKY